VIAVAWAASRRLAGVDTFEQRRVAVSGCSSILDYSSKLLGQNRVEPGSCAKRTDISGIEPKKYFSAIFWLDPLE
jgi:hypothetical protein